MLKSEILGAVRSEYGVVRTGMLGLASRLAHRLAACTSPEGCSALVDAEVRLILRSAHCGRGRQMTLADDLSAGALRGARCLRRSLILGGMGRSPRSRSGGRQRAAGPAGGRSHTSANGCGACPIRPSKWWSCKNPRGLVTRGRLIHCASYYIAQDPSPVLVVLPRESDAEDFSQKRNPAGLVGYAGAL